MSLDGVTTTNIGRRGINQRRLVGIWFLFLGVILAAILVITRVNIYVRAIAFILFFLGFLGVIQANRRTCVLLAYQGKQHLDGLPEPILDPRTRKLLWSRAVNIILASALLAALATAVTIYL